MLKEPNSTPCTDEEGQSPDQSIQIPLFDPSNQMYREIQRVYKLVLTSADKRSEADADLLQECVRLFPDFVAALRAHPHAPLKRTANIGGAKPLVLDIIGMMNVFLAKVAEARRLDPKRLLAESTQAREIYLNIAEAQEGAFHELLGRKDDATATILNPDSYLAGFNPTVIMTNTAFAERIAVIAHDDLGLEIPPYAVSVAQANQGILDTSHDLDAQTLEESAYF